MGRDVDASVLNHQHVHWDSTLSQNPDMFGSEPSESAIAAATRFGVEGVVTLLELGAGQGRDTFFFAGQGFEVTATDYTKSAIAAIEAQAPEYRPVVSCVRHDVRDRLPFPEGSFGACYSHMLFCMALTTPQLEALVAEVHRVLRPGGFMVYTARTTEDTHHGTGIDRGDDMYEHGGFIVHFFSPQLIERLAHGFEIVDQFEFTEAELPRRLVSVMMRKR